MVKDLDLIILSSNIRHTRKSGVMKFYNGIVNGEMKWGHSEIMAWRVKGEKYYHLIEGAHRIEFMKMLKENGLFEKFFPDGVCITVYDKFTDEEEIFIASRNFFYFVNNFF